MHGAGGTDGGIGRFFLGLIMLVGGCYLFLQSIDVSLGMGLGYQFFSAWGMGMTSGMVLVPLAIGVGIVFYNAKNPIGWVVMVASFLALAYGVIAQTRLTLRHMSAFDLIVILVLMVGGLGIFLSSLRASNSKF